MYESSHLDDLITRDTRLPELAAILDEQLVAEHLQLNSSSVHLDYIRYKPMTNCVARFRIDQSDSRFVYAKTFSADDGLKVANAPLKVTHGCEVPVEFQQRSVLYKFPTDAKLKSLSKLALQNSWLGERFGLSSSALQMDVISYKPERRCVLKLHEPGSAYILKLFSKRSFEAAHNAATFAKNLSVVSPKILKKSRRHQTLLFDLFDGPTLREEIVANRGALGCAIAGKALANFHATDASLARPITQSADHGLLTWLIPQTASQIQAIVAQASADIQKTATTNVALHGDFYDKQIILATNGEPVILDLDELGQGDHRIDLATFIAHLEAAKPDYASLLLENFLSAYTSNSSNPTTTLNAYVALATLQLAHHGFRSGAKDWRTKTIISIDRAQRWLDRKGEY